MSTHPGTQPDLAKSRGTNDGGRGRGTRAARPRIGRRARTARAEHYDPRAVQEKWQERWAELDPFRASDDPDGFTAAHLPAGHVPLPVRRPAHGPRRGVRDRGCGRALLLPARAQRAAPDRLGRVRPARGERGDQEQLPPGRLDLQEHRDPGRLVPALRGLLRLVPAALHLRSRLLPLEPVAVPAFLRARPGLPQGRLRQLVPGRPDRAGQRAGHRRPLRAVRRRGGPARADPVVFQDH